MITIIAIVLIVEIFFHPRLDKTSEGKMLLWYGRMKRKYIVLW